MVATDKIEHFRRPPGAGMSALLAGYFSQYFPNYPVFPLTTATGLIGLAPTNRLNTQIDKLTL